MVDDRRREAVPAALLEIRGLVVSLGEGHSTTRLIDGVSFDVRAGETVGLVGESGSGKSISALAMANLLAGDMSVDADELKFNGASLIGMDRRRRRKLLGSEIGFVFQDPLSSLNPLMTIGDQIAEVIRLHQPALNGNQRRALAIERLSEVGIGGAERRLGQYPHEFSGGMRQRVGIAMAMANNPKLLIADEPTTALDVTVQAQVLETLRRVQASHETSVLMITHDLGVIAEMADRVVVLYGGRVMETAATIQLFDDPRHPYTRALLSSRPEATPRGGTALSIPGFQPDARTRPEGCVFHTRCQEPLKDESLCGSKVPPLVGNSPELLSACHFADALPPFTPLDARHTGAGTDSSTAPQAADGLEVTDLRVRYPVKSHVLLGRRGSFEAVKGVSFRVAPGRTLAVVGESGCGKSSLARAVLGLESDVSGSILVNGQAMPTRSGPELREYRRRIQTVFQDPYSSFNPRRTLGASLVEPLLVHRAATGSEAKDRVATVLRDVGLDSAFNKYPHQFSGGELQRLAIVRAIIDDPAVVVLDEPVSALDVSVRAQVLNILQRLQRRSQVAYVLISHDLSVVRQVADEIAVMYLGEIVEHGTCDEIFETPAHPYTRALLDSIPAEHPSQRGRERLMLTGGAPDIAEPVSGCQFHPRCFMAADMCAEREPELIARDGVSWGVACHFAAPCPVRPSRSTDDRKADNRISQSSSDRNVN